MKGDLNCHAWQAFDALLLSLVYEKFFSLIIITIIDNDNNNNKP